MRSAAGYLAALALTIFAGAANAAPCEAVAGAVAGLEQSESRLVPAGSLGATSAPLADLPAFCRVTGSVRTSPSTAIRVEMWMPAQGWNGRFLPAGWAFYAGTMNPALLAGPLRQGYATATTDGGGVAGQASFLLNQPEKLIDWGERAWRETTLKAKAAVAAYYGRPAAHSYWNGGGGSSRQGLKAIQRFPEDYDGAAVGGLAVDPSHFTFAQVALWQAANGPEPLTPEHLPAINRAALAACDGDDGVADGLIRDPEGCRFDPGVLLCRAAPSADCLTASQVAAVRRIYAPTRNPRTGAAIFGPVMPGSELGWRGAMLTPAPGGFALDYFRYVVFDDAAWDWRGLDYDRDVAAAERVHPSVNAVDPDIRRFVDRGGRLILWGGWNDVAIPPDANVAYYKAVVSTLGEARAAQSVRLYMIPGMGHMLGGAGPETYELDTQAVLETWREQGGAPGALVAVRRVAGAPERTLLLCPYPQIAKYRGGGDPKDAASFECIGAVRR